MPTSDNLLYALVIMLGINFILAAGQYSMEQLNPNGATQFFNPSNTIICNAFNQGCFTGNSSINDINAGNKLPDFSTSVSPTTSNPFWDAPSIITQNMRTQGKSNFFLNLVTAPYTFIANIGLDQQLAKGIAAIWYLAMLMLLVAFIWGR